ncbi:MAG: hypothetical protein N4A74_04180 [Carboxylicivirga sp.]|nr:hypothetical protein [Carboxylicivirga sp.]
MHKLKYLLILLTLAVTNNAWSQSFDEWKNRLAKVDSIVDVNTRKSELEKLRSDLETILKNTSDQEALDWPERVIRTKTEDGKWQALGFGTSTFKGFYQFEWLLISEKGIWGFNEQWPMTSLKEIGALNFSWIVQTDRYTLSLKAKNHLYFKVNDVYTKCLFEELAAQENDADRDSLNEELQNRLLLLWNDPELYDDSFTQLKRMKTLISGDKQVKVCTYNMQRSDFIQKFYGAVVVNQKGIQVNLLNDTSEKVRSPERSSLTNKKWYGALYYEMLENVSGNRTYYTLMGYKGHDEFKKTRVLDVLIVQNGRLRFGMPVFKSDRLTKNRVVFHYSAHATMMLRYDAKLKMIVMDNLAPTQPMFRGVYQYYGPDFSYNGYKFKKGVWELQKDIDLRNPK